MNGKQNKNSITLIYFALLVFILDLSCKSIQIHVKVDILFNFFFSELNVNKLDKIKYWLLFVNILVKIKVKNNMQFVEDNSLTITFT